MGTALSMVVHLLLLAIPVSYPEWKATKEPFLLVDFSSLVQDKRDRAVESERSGRPLLNESKPKRQGRRVTEELLGFKDYKKEKGGRTADHQPLTTEKQTEEETEEVQRKALQATQSAPSMDGMAEEATGVIEDDEEQPVDSQLIGKGELHTAESMPSEVHDKEVSSVPETTFGSASGKLVGPDFIRRVTPRYPVMARRLGVEGEVLLLLTIDEEGRLVDIEVLKGDSYGFEEAAIEALRRSTFRPAMKDGRPTKTRATLRVRFQLR